MSTSTCISVLRIGPFPEGNNCAIKLKAALLNHFAVESNRSAEKDTIILSNKYFTAQICLAEIGSTFHAITADHGGSSTIPTFAEDGLLLVFDSVMSNPNNAHAPLASFDCMESVHDRAVRGETPAGDLLRLCIGVGKNETLSTKDYEQEYSRRVLWCLDRGYEYVEADLSESGVTSGHDARDKEGFARIVEALAGTVWSSAVMERRVQVKRINSNPHDAADPAGSTGYTEESENTCSYEPPDPSVLPPLLRIDEDMERERKARDTLFAADRSVDDETNEEQNYPDQNREEEIAQERALNALEGSLREASRIRELSKTGQLSDDERRKRAGDAAMLLMDMMGQMDFESSDDEEGSLDGNDGH